MNRHILEKILPIVVSIKCLICIRLSLHTVDPILSNLLLMVLSMVLYIASTSRIIYINNHLSTS